MNSLHETGPRRAHQHIWLLVAGALAVLLASCASSTLPLDADAANLFDLPNNAIADLTSEGSEEVPRNELLQAVARAQSAGTNLRVVVADADGEFVPAKAVVDRYGGTAISYQSNRTGFEGASRDMSASQLDRAIDAAKEELNIGDSAAAFVGVLEDEGLEARGLSLSRTLIWLLVAAAAIFMLWALMQFMRERRRRLKHQSEFAERKTVLHDWAAQLGPQVEALAPAVAAGSADDQQVFAQAREFAGSILPTIEQASTDEDLDGAEMRISRAAIKLRDLQRSLEM